MDSIGKTITVVTDEANRVNAVIVDQGRSIILIDGLWWWSRFYFSLLTAVEEDSEDEKPGWDEDTKKGTVLTPKSST